MGGSAYLAVGNSLTAFHAIAIPVDIITILALSAFCLKVQSADVTLDTIVVNLGTVGCAAGQLA